jgi:tripartite-type tricarboxylate transporter receptor subunit TctC
MSIAPNRQRRQVATALAAAACSLLTLSAVAQESYPVRSIRVIVPYAPGGLPDSVIRRVAPLMEKELGQTVVVDNKPGANGVVAAQALLSAPNDGYTLIFSDSAFLNMSPLLAKSLPYDVRRDFAPVAQAARAPNFLAVHKDVPARTFAEFAALIKKQPGKLNCGSSGVGTLHHLTLETMKSLLELDAVHVPYRGSGQSVPALIGKQTDCTIAAYPSLAGHAANGNARILAVAASKPSPLAPDAAPMFAGKGDLEYSFLLGFVGRAGTPDAVTARIGAAITAAMSDAGIVAALRRAGVEPAAAPAAAYRASLDADGEQLRAAAKAINLQPE